MTSHITNYLQNLGYSVRCHISESNGLHVFKPLPLIITCTHRHSVSWWKQYYFSQPLLPHLQYLVRHLVFFISFRAHGSQTLLHHDFHLPSPFPIFQSLHKTENWDLNVIIRIYLGQGLLTLILPGHCLQNLVTRDRDFHSGYLK